MFCLSVHKFSHHYINLYTFYNIADSWYQWYLITDLIIEILKDWQSLPWHPSQRTRGQMHGGLKSLPSPGTALRVWGDRLHGVLKHPSPGTALRVWWDRLHGGSKHGTLSEYEGIDYMEYRKTLPLVPLSEYDGTDSWRIETSFPCYPSRSARRPTMYMSLLLVPLSESTRGQTAYVWDKQGFFMNHIWSTSTLLIKVLTIWWYIWWCFAVIQSLVHPAWTGSIKNNLVCIPNMSLPRCFSFENWKGFSETKKNRCPSILHMSFLQGA